MRTSPQSRLRIADVRDVVETTLQQLACTWELGTAGLVCRWRPVPAYSRHRPASRRLDR
jgi:hypothetical protein